MVAAADNAELWVQPLSVDDGSIALARGRTGAGESGRLQPRQEGFPHPRSARAPHALWRPLDAVVLGAAFQALLEPPPEHAERARRLAAAMRWVVKSWLNSPKYPRERPPRVLEDVQ
jgi:hypothetical protein